MGAAEVVLWFVALAALSAAALQDLKYRLIPNILVLVVLCAAIGLRIAGGLPAAGYSVIATAIVSAVAYVLADRNTIGWGDGKMIAAASLLVPPQSVVALILYIALAGGFLSCLYLLARLSARRKEKFSHSKTRSQSSSGSFGRLIRGEMVRIAAYEPMPYGVAILGGVSGWLLTRVMECCCATYCSP